MKTQLLIHPGFSLGLGVAFEKLLTVSTVYPQARERYGFEVLGKPLKRLPRLTGAADPQAEAWAE